MKQSKLIQMYLESEMTPEQITAFRAKIVELVAQIQAVNNKNETDLDKSAFVVALTQYMEMLGEEK